MKKVFSILMIIAVLFCFNACSNSSATSGSESSTAETSSSRTEQTSTTAQEIQSVTERTTPATEPEEIEPKSLVVYFSCTGNTKSVAEKIAQLKGADLYEIVPAEPYTNEDLNYNNNSYRANREMDDPSARPAIGSNTVDISAYDTVYIGYPIWWGTMPRIINTFLDTYDLSGKTVMPFCTSGGSGVSKTVSDIKAEEPAADVRDGLRASGSSDSSIDEWISRNGLL
ncbi:MAG: NAD(P)H-dependent oxidoreductase [Oscillospiraceae bacterium]|nr:NAD(P)H-dependent oxidoreductase [Oscillospiraceae bacterium]